jgi:soluble lytic murein transglycosylase-like protein
VAALKRAAVLASLAFVAPAQAQSVDHWRSYIDEAALRYGVPTSWIEQVMRAESNGRTMLAGRPIRSRAGAIGLMQLMPGTWNAMRRALDLGHDPDDPRDNILAGTFYLRLMCARFGYPGLFAAYNAGPNRYATHLATGQRLPGETIAYLAKVDGSKPPAARIAVVTGPDILFVVRRTPGAGAGRDSEIGSLFAVKNDIP